eukprot:3040937-Rhodomonas_salina.1
MPLTAGGELAPSGSAMCYSCGEMKDKLCFSKNQLKQLKTAYCAVCIEAKDTARVASTPPNESDCRPGEQKGRTSSASAIAIPQRSGRTGSGDSPSIHCPKNGTPPTAEQLLEEHHQHKAAQGNMIYYPVDFSAMMRGELETSDVIVGHNKTFTLTHSIFADR